MLSNAKLESVNKRQRQQAFDQFDSANSQDKSLDDFILLPNQFAYKVDCSTTELVKIRGDLKGLTGISKMDTIQGFQNRIKSNLIEKYVEETIASFNFMLGNGLRTIPLRNSFSSIIEIEKPHDDSAIFYRQVFALKSDQNGIITHTGGICTLIDNVKVSEVPFEQHKCIGPDGIYFRAEELLHFKDTFSVREMEVLKLISNGFRTSAIADLLSLSAKTVETHRKNMLKKLEAKTTPHMVALAKDMGLI